MLFRSEPGAAAAGSDGSHEGSMAIGVPGGNQAVGIVGGQGRIEIILIVGGTIEGLETDDRMRHMAGDDGLVPDPPDAGTAVRVAEQGIRIIDAGINYPQQDTPSGGPQCRLVQDRRDPAAFQGCRVQKPIQLGNGGIVLAGRGQEWYIAFWDICNCIFLVYKIYTCCIGNLVGDFLAAGGIGKDKVIIIAGFWRIDAVLRGSSLLWKAVSISICRNGDN